MPEVHQRMPRSPLRWALENPVLQMGEHGLETGTGRFKIGDGDTKWNKLPHFTPSQDFEALVEDGRLSESGLTSAFARRALAVGGVGAVVITMDDAYKAMNTVAALMSIRGQRGTFCITPGLMNNPATRLIAADVVALAEAGHEIAAHSQTHANFTSLTPAQQASELAAPKSYLEGLIGKSVTTFAYPYGTNSGGRTSANDPFTYPIYERVLDTALNTAVALHPRWTDMPPSLIRRTAWDSPAHTQCLEMVRHAAERPVVATFFFHDLGTVNNPTLAQVIELLDLCVELGVPVITAAEAYGSFHTLRNPMFQGSIAPWRSFTAGPDGAVTPLSGLILPDGIPGTTAVRLTAGPGTNFGYVRQVHPVRPGVAYTLSFRARVNSGAIVQGNDSFGRVSGLDYGQGAVADVVTTSAPTSGVWTKFQIDYNPGPGVAYANVDLVATDIATPTSVDFTHVWFGPKALGDFG